MANESLILCAETDIMFKKSMSKRQTSETGELSPGMLPASSHTLPTSKIVQNVTKSSYKPVLAMVISLVLYGCHTSG